MYSRSFSYLADYRSRNPWQVIHDGQPMSRCRDRQDALGQAARVKAVVVRVDDAARTVYALSSDNPRLPVGRKGGQHAGSVTTG